MTRHAVGQGFDTHRLVPGRMLILGGIIIPYDKGLAGHSDGDCLIHAVCDALLGAAAAGDMGVHFPSSDEQWKDASGLVFLEQVRQILRRLGFTIENIDATVVAQAPPLAPHLPQMRMQLSRTLELDASVVSVKAKSTDGLGAIGRGEGIAAFACASLVQRKKLSTRS
jgi:2-C-methyl-D-erythritol 2,4-cyclodiphosphate synthase